VCVCVCVCVCVRVYDAVAGLDQPEIVKQSVRKTVCLAYVRGHNVCVCAVCVCLCVCLLCVCAVCALCAFTCCSHNEQS